MPHGTLTVTSNVDLIRSLVAPGGLLAGNDRGVAMRAIPSSSGGAGFAASGAGGTSAALGL